MAKQYPTIQAQEMIVDNTCEHTWLCGESVQLSTAHTLGSSLVLVERRTTLSPYVLTYCMLKNVCTARSCQRAVHCLPDLKGCAQKCGCQSESACPDLTAWLPPPTCRHAAREPP